VRRWRGLFAALAVMSFLVVQTMPASADPEDEARLAQLAREKQELERAIQVSRANAERYRQEASRFASAVRSANSRIAQLSAEQSRAESEAEALRIDIAIAEEQLALVAFQLKETQSLIDSLSAEATEQSKQLERREEIYATHLRTTYKQSRISPLEMLLSSRSLTDFVNRVQALIFIDRQDRQLVGEIRSLKAATVAKQETVALKQLEIKGLQGQIQEQRASLAKKKADFEEIARAKAAAVSETDQQRAIAAQNQQAAAGATQRAQAETAALNRRLEQTEAAYAALAAQLAARSGLAVFTGRMNVWPVAGVVTSNFGYRWGGFHNGLDIAAPMYTPVKAGAPGKVVTVGKPYLAYGDTATVVIIAHGSNFSTLYGHLDDRVRPPVVSVGQFVTAGQTIGYIGMTGWTSGPHVHFMTIVNGNPVNPRQYLP
jgi:murein DD-endopeptidase MepM/ murein hydrolase activator NlpD